VQVGERKSFEELQATTKLNTDFMVDYTLAGRIQDKATRENHIKELETKFATKLGEVRERFKAGG